jgi:hypothetical protein
MKPLVISMVVGAALCSVMSVPASAMPMSNLAAAASDLALGQSVRYGRYHHRYRHYGYRPSYYGGYGASYYGGYGASYYGGYRPSYYGGYGPSYYGGYGPSYYGRGY